MANMFNSIVDKGRRFLHKSGEDRKRAIKATLQSVLHRSGAAQPMPVLPARMLANAETIRHRINTLTMIESERYRKEILSDPIYQDARRLPPFGFKVYSQNDEDGIIQEIFNRIGTSARTFVEFGVQNGLECNTLKLLVEGWSGLWLEGAELHVNEIRARFRDVIQGGRLHVRQAFIDCDNINDLIGQVYSDEVDLLSIDVDGNDVYLLNAMNVIQPRVIVIEYNAKFPPPMSIAATYDPAFRWGGTDYMGASLAAITKIADRKGYALVGCSVSGVNAFYVRQDLLGDHFCPPYTAENHYQPTRYFLRGTFAAGHAADWGPYVTI